MGTSPDPLCNTGSQPRGWDQTVNAGQMEGEGAWGDGGTRGALWADLTPLLNIPTLVGDSSSVILSRGVRGETMAAHPSSDVTSDCRTLARHPGTAEMERNSQEELES